MVVLVLIAASLIGGTIIHAQQPQDRAIGGERFTFPKLPDRPSWVFSGVWAGGQDDELILIDTIYGRSMRFSSVGKYLGDLPPEVSTEPSIIGELGADKLLLENETEDGSLVEFKGVENPTGRRFYELLDTVNSDKQQLVGVYNWVPVTEHSLLLFGDVMDGASGYSAFVQLDLRNPAGFKVLDRMGIATSERQLNLLGGNYLASHAGEPCYLRVRGRTALMCGDAPPIGLVRVRDGRHLPVRVPDLPEARGMQAVPRLYGALERATFPAGLYGWQGHLYVLMRFSGGGGGAPWWRLLKISPKSGIVWNRPITTTASHLSVVVGDRYWAFIEKGPMVRSTSHQEIISFLRTPVEQLRN